MVEDLFAGSEVAWQYAEGVELETAHSRSLPLALVVSEHQQPEAGLLKSLPAPSHQHGEMMPLDSMA